jgi:hypothetical protein
MKCDRYKLTEAGHFSTLAQRTQIKQMNLKVK